MAENSLALGQILNLISDNSKLKDLFNEYEAELYKFQRLSAANDQMREHMNSLTLDHMLVGEAFATMNEQRDKQTKANDIVQLCFSQALKIDHLLKHEKFNNICKYTMLVKQNEAKTMLKFLENKNMSELNNMATLESRHIVMQLRQAHDALMRSKQELDILKQSVEDSQHRHQVTLEWATGQLNKKILNLLIKRKELMELKLAHCKVHKPQQRQQALAQDIPASSLERSLDFLTNFSNGNIANKTIQSNAANNNEENALRSILISDSKRTTPSPNKQVRFAPSPATEDEDDNMNGLDNWDALMEQMDVYIDNLDQLPSTLESAMVMSANITDSFAQSSTDNINASDSIPTTSLDAFTPGTKFVQSPNGLVISSEIISAIPRNGFSSVTTSDSIPDTSVENKFGQYTGNADASDLTAITLRDAVPMETHNTENQSVDSEDTTSDYQDGSGNAMLFPSSNDDFFFNFSDEINRQNANDDYEL